MDERMEAGRHHLTNGLNALHQGFLDESRSHFETALLQFRGPELRIGEAHALRGLGEVELHGGNLGGAENVVRAAIREYQEVRNQLDRVDPGHASNELRRDSEEGEASAHTLLGEVLIRAGRAEDARHELAYAHQLYATLGEEVPSAAGVYMNLARLGMREGRTQEARGSVEKAIDLLSRCGDAVGQCGAWLLLAEIERLSGRLAESDTALSQAMRLADETHQVAMQGRARSQQASLLAQQGRLEESTAAYDDALGRIRDAGDIEMEAYSLLGRGDARSRSRDPGALFDLVEGTRLLAQLEHRHGLGTSMLRLSEHALRQSMPAFALAAAESAKQFWQLSDPKRGVGHALRVQVLSLAALKKWPAVITAAHFRAAIAGDLQDNAVVVRDFYRERAPAGLLSELDLMDTTQLELRTEAMVEALLEPTLRALDLDFQSLGVPGGALAITAAFAQATPSQAGLRPGPTPVASAGKLPADPPDDRAPYDVMYAPPVSGLGPQDQPRLPASHAPTIGVPSPRRGPQGES
ncbi:MAG: tetratricopeptide repeat protein [Myxococcota bacterium]